MRKWKQNKGIEADKDRISKGFYIVDDYPIEADKDRISKWFYIVDDYPEEAVTINQDGVQVTDSKGQVVKGLEMALYESLDKAPTGF
ncbi:Agglutinin receptor [Streptococcus pneumoniae]|nr:Agglutinin receptor [Streptococcus pneumoniae]